MKQVIDRIRRYPLLLPILLPVALLPLASLLVRTIIMSLIRKVHPLPPILEMIATQGLVCLLAAGSFYFLRGKIDASPDSDEAVPPEISWHWLWEGLLPLLLILMAVNKFYLTSVSWDVGPHRFFDELGLDAAYVQRIFQGQVFFRDCVMIYNFLMFWPIFILMKIFGHQLWVIHAWTLVLELVCLYGLFATLRFITRDRWMALIGLGLCIFLFYPDVPYPHASYSRFHLGILPGLLAAWEWRKKKSFPWIGTLAAAIYFFYTYDYGLVSCAALTVSALLFFRTESHKIFRSSLVWLVPVMLFFFWLVAATGGIGSALNTLFYFPLHYHAADVWWPFPDIVRDTVGLFIHPGKTAVRAWMLSQLAHGPYLIYALAFLGLWFGPLSRARPENKFLAGYLVLFACGCAPKYIFRTGYLLTGTHLYLAPAVILAFWMMANWGKLSAGGMDRRFEPRILSAWLLIVLLGYLRCHWDVNMTQRLKSSPFILHSPSAPANYVPLETPSTRHIYIPKAWKWKLESLNTRLTATMTGANEMYVFPYDPIWYFLLDKKNASISDITGNALPGGWASVFASVQKSPPPFILFSNFSQKPQVSLVNMVPLLDILRVSYEDKLTEGSFHLYRKTGKQ